MKVSEEKHRLHLAQLIAVSFIVSAICYFASMLFPIDLSVNPPVISLWMMTLGRIQTALLILGCTALGIKLSEEKRTMPSIGFTMMAIAQGVMFVIFTITINSNEKIEETYRMFSASLYLLIPAMLTIALYGDFPKWVNIIGIFSLVLFITENIAFVQAGRLDFWMIVIDFIGNSLLALTALFWGIYVWRNAKKEIG